MHQSLGWHSIFRAKAEKDTTSSCAKGEKEIHFLVRGSPLKSNRLEGGVYCWYFIPWIKRTEKIWGEREGKRCGPTKKIIVTFGK